MKRRKHRYRGYSKRTIILIIALFCSLFFGMGYSLLGTSLDLSGDINISKYDHTLFGVLEKAAKRGTYAKTYTGEHQDSMDASLSTKNIYHWYVSDSNNIDTIKDKYNVIFADQCWLMIRTNDTGGVRLLYNGEAENGQCLSSRGNHVGYTQLNIQTLSTNYYYGTDYYYNSSTNLFTLDGLVTTGTIHESQYTCKSSSSSGTCSTLYLVDSLASGSKYRVLSLDGNSHYSQYGELQFSEKDDSISDVGYMYNKKYDIYTKDATYVSMLSQIHMQSSTSYYYGMGVSYDSNNNTYSLTGITSDTWANTYNSSTGLYTCNSSSLTECDKVYYITIGTSNYMFAFIMKDGNLLNYYDTEIAFGEDYVENNGTYTLTNPTTINKSDWYTNYRSLENYYTCGDNSTSCSVIRALNSVSNTGYRYYSSNAFLYSNDFTYNDVTNTYTLGSDRVSYWDTTTSDYSSNIATHHYSCFNETGECSTINYIFTATGYGTIEYHKLTNGRSMEDAFDEMINNDDINTINSFVKSGVDQWYKKHLLYYANYLEDTIFCNNRNNNFSSSAWNPAAGKFGTMISFSSVSPNDIICSREIDCFSLSNPKAHLIYPVGLLSSKEASLLGNRNVITSGESYWLASPNYFNSSGAVILTNNGFAASSSIIGVRPVISLKPGTEYVSGTGSMADPYIVDATPAEPEMHTLTIRYWLDNNEIYDPYIVNLAYGEEYDVASPYFDDFVPDQLYVDGVLMEDTTVNVYYSPRPFTLRLRLYRDGSLYNTITSQIPYGEYYDMATPSFVGFTADIQRVSGTMPNSDVSYDVIYYRNEHTLTINYVYLDGSPASAPYTGTYLFEEHYSVTSPTIQNYTASIPVVDGNMPDRNVPVTVIYRYAGPDP